MASLVIDASATLPWCFDAEYARPRTGAGRRGLGLDTCRSMGAGAKTGHGGRRIPRLQAGRTRPDGLQSTLWAVRHTAERADERQRHPRAT